MLKNRIVTVHFKKQLLFTIFSTALLALVATLISSNSAYAAPLNSFDVTYYNNIDFTGRSVHTVESSINHDWGTSSPHPRINPDTFSAKYLGSFELEEGTYEFTATVDDGIRLMVDGNVVIEAYYDQAPTTYTESINVSSGTHTITVEYYERYGSAVLVVDWEKIGGPSPTPPPPTPTPTSTPPTPQPTSTPPTPEPTSTPPTPIPSPTPNQNPENRINWNGQAWYLHGVNMPWYNWSCDFGCNNNGGVSQTSINNEINSRFNQLDSANVHVVRWWMFPGNPWQINQSGNGTPTGINSAIYADIDAALDLAETHDLYYTFVLFSAPSSVPQGWLNDPTQRQALASSLQELFAHYANHPRIMTWEVFNEPEWDMWNGAVDSNNTVATVTAIANAVHASSNKYATVGSAMLDGLPYWTNTPVDYYDAHWYDYMSPGDWCALCTNYDEVKARYGLTKPLVIGEFYAGYDVDSGRFDYWYDNGYAGAYAWSLFSERTSDGLQINMNAAASFGNSKPDIGPQN
ncbi:MAG: PA14 domain-containing protein [Candidatus Promineifilaceae bacterium]